MSIKNRGLTEFIDVCDAMCIGIAAEKSRNLRNALNHAFWRSCDASGR
jgi:hypothetical protein